MGLQLDDYVHRMVFLGEAEPAVEPADAFNLVDGDSDARQRMMDSGVLPWWTAPELSFRFFRPLAVGSMWLDYVLWPDSPFLMHLHSLLWLGALVLVAAALYKRLSNPGAAASLAAVAFALDDAHAFPAAWLANRNALLAATFGLAALWAHHRFRREGWRWGRVVSPVFLTLSLLSAEAGLGAFAYFAAYALFVERGPWWGRVVSLLPAGLVGFLWALSYKLGGYGTWGSGLYLDPGSEPWTFLAHLPERALLLLWGQWSPLPADLAALLDGPERSALLALAAASLAFLGVLLAPILRREPLARFFAVGMVLSLVPVAATVPSNRLLLFVGFGAFGLLGQLVAGWWQESAWFARRAVTRTTAAWARLLLAGVHLVLAPLVAPSMAWSTYQFGQPPTDAILSAQGVTAGEDGILLQVPDYLLYASFWNPVRRAHDLPTSARVIGLAAGPNPVTVSRLDANRLRLVLPKGPLTGQLGALFRSPRQPFRVGEITRLELLTVEVVGVEPSGKLTIEVETRGGLERPGLSWRTFRDGAIVPFLLPAVGETVELGAAFGPFDRPAP